MYPLVSASRSGRKSGKETQRPRQLRYAHEYVQHYLLIGIVFRAAPRQSVARFKHSLSAVQELTQVNQFAIDWRPILRYNGTDNTQLNKWGR